MLARSAGRRHQKRTSQLLATSFAQLNLPWLAPAQLRWSASRAAAASASRTPPTRKHERNARQLRNQTRGLATATDSYSIRSDSDFLPPNYSSPFRNRADEHVPFDFTSPYSPPPAARIPALGRFGDAPIILNTTTVSPDALIKLMPGLSGTSKELLSHLYTSIAVGRGDRAAAIAQRLTEQCGPGSSEANLAHTAYLEYLLRSLTLQGRDSPQSQLILKDMQRWFEVEVRSKGVQTDATMLITVMRGVIRSLDGSGRDRSIRRYAAMAEELGTDVHDEVLFSEEYDDNEFAVLCQAIQELAAEVNEDQQIETIGEEISPESIREEAAKTMYPPRAQRIDLENTPQVQSTQQKGQGLEYIKQAMRSLKDIPEAPADASAEKILELAYKKEKRLEESAVDIAIERWHKADEDLKKIGIYTSMQNRPVAALMWQWYQALLPALQKELEEVKKLFAGPNPSAHDERSLYGPYLELLPLSKVAANTILTTTSKIAFGKGTNSAEGTEAKLATLTLVLASAIEKDCQVEASAGRAGQMSRVKAAKANKRPRKKPAKVAKGEISSGSTTDEKPKSKERQNIELLASKSWPSDVKVKLGALLTSKLIETAHLPVTRLHPRTKQKVTQMQPAFLHKVKFQAGKKVGMVVPNPALIEKLQSEPVGSLIAKQMPMVVEPRPWKSWDEGAYLQHPTPIVRLPAGDKSGRDYFQAADARQELDTVYKGLTALSKVPWRVNPDVFKVQLEAWNSGDAIANFAPLHPTLPQPPEPEDASDEVARRKWLGELRSLENERAGLHSKRCFQNFQMEIARSLLNEKLYFPHNMDFRGRAYPIPPYLNHMGADNVRALLEFAEGKELGPDGLRWLKIHLATVAGHDKASMEERVEFTMSHLDNIYDSVRNPLDGRRWWLQAEDAWQTLAACYELTSALDSPDPTKFVSHLPVQQDGTCNGLQHYAALGGDKAGAAQVNLEPGDRPADVYTAVAEAVKAEVEKDAKDGNPVAQILHGRLTRKCVKQPVMTNVYGVTFYGAVLQVKKQLKVLFPDLREENAINIGHLSHYVTVKIFKSLGTMFAGAQSIQRWLGECADRISTCLSPEQIVQLKDGAPQQQAGGRGRPAEADDLRKIKPTRAGGSSESHLYNRSKPMFKSTVVWTTPLRLPVVQPYRTPKGTKVSTGMQTISIQEPQVWDPVSKRKQLQAFPPNFIHSLDATHMLLSALKCSENDMTFASIHDSFWTHACDVNRMSEVLRDSFVAMHSEDIIGRLREEFLTRYRGYMYLASINATSPVGVKILKRRAEIRKDKTMKMSELALEAERMRLINSEDAEERAKGEAMVTPGSLMMNEVDASAFEAPAELQGQLLGDMPDKDAASTAAEVEATNTDTNVLAEEATDEDMTPADEKAPAEDAVLEAAEAESERMTAPKTKVTRPGTKRKPKQKVHAWLPLTFPEVPQKGDFDVRRLRESRYFFH